MLVTGVLDLLPLNDAIWSTPPNRSSHQNPRSQTELTNHQSLNAPKKERKKSEVKSRTARAFSFLLTGHNGNTLGRRVRRGRDVPVL